MNDHSYPRYPPYPRIFKNSTFNTFYALFYAFMQNLCDCSFFNILKDMEDMKDTTYKIK